MVKRSQNVAVIAGLAALYFLTGKLGLMLAFVHPSATAVWPPTGITLAAFLLFGYEAWPGALLGAFLVNITTAGSVPVCLGIALGNTLEGLVGAYLVNKYAGGRHFTDRTRNILKFAIFAGVVSTMLSAMIGVACLCLGGYAAWTDAAGIWSTWWLGDAAGCLVVAPLILLWVAQPRPQWRWKQSVEAAALLACLIIVGLVVFNGLLIAGNRAYPLEYLCIPFLMWAAFRFGPREVASATLVLAAAAIWGTFHNLGPFAVGTRTESFLLLQTFVGVVAVMSLSLAALFAERQRAETHARVLAVSDPLTGLGNYRKLIETLESEIKRSDRTSRPFAFLVMDLDGLKQINDAYGHQVGNQALCRLAHVLRTHSRVIDTAVRQGGDEFALILPEANAEAAAQIGQRINRRLAAEHTRPPLAVSIGSAVWPQDGSSIEQLLRVADRALYEDKRRHHVPSMEDHPHHQST
jgi:diguanylate cyclase (GGDEF)-like protein